MNFAAPDFICLQTPIKKSMFGVSQQEPEEVLRCAGKLVNAMAIPKQYWRQWTEAMYSLAITVDIMQQLTHGGKPLVKAVGSIYNVPPGDLTNPSFLLEKASARR